MRFMLSQVQEASSDCVRVQLDYPVQDVAVLDTAVYVDPRKWWGYLSRRRSYRVGNIFRKEGEIRVGAPQVYSDRFGRSTNKRRLRIAELANSRQVSDGEARISHFAPEGYIPKDYNPCYFHFLFQPAPSMQSDIARHWNSLMDLHQQRSQDDAPRIMPRSWEYQPPGPGEQLPPSLGIHFRTGDVTAFGLNLNDTRVRSGDIMTAWNQMLECADQLARRLFPSIHDSIPYFLATDNRALKEHILSGQVPMAGPSRSTLGDSQDARRTRLIYTTDITPQSFWQAWSGDRDAWMELYLLSMQAGLVVNVLPRHYTGHATRTSFFSVLARNVGLMDSSRVQECILD
jgi:hypothetical protein